MGRVITLVKQQQQQVDQAERVYGLAYEIRPENVKKTFDYLNFREKCGYTMHEVTFHPCHELTGAENNNHTEPFKCICYFANEDNFYYAAEQDQLKMSAQIAETIGPSGSNREYLFNFCSALRNLVLNECKLDKSILDYDRHIFELEDLVKKSSSLK